MGLEDILAAASSAEDECTPEDEDWEEELCEGYTGTLLEWDEWPGMEAEGGAGAGLRIRRWCGSITEGMVVAGKSWEVRISEWLLKDGEVQPIAAGTTGDAEVVSQLFGGEVKPQWLFVSVGDKVSAEGEQGDTDGVEMGDDDGVRSGDDLDVADNLDCGVTEAEVKPLVRPGGLSTSSWVSVHGEFSVNKQVVVN